MSNQTIHLRSGRDVRVEALRQWAIYSGLLEGLPTTRMNRGIIDSILSEERQSGAEPHLIPPQEIPIEWRREDPYPFGNPARLPGIACVARLCSSQPARDNSQHFSFLTVVWFQDEFAFPIEKLAWEQMASLDWERLAMDGIW